MRCLLSSLAILIGMATGSLFAQDVVYTRAGHMFESQILKVTPTKIYFKKFNAGRSPAYELPTDYLIRIEYENGTTDTFDENGVATISDTATDFPTAQEVRDANLEKLAEAEVAVPEKDQPEKEGQPETINPTLEEPAYTYSKEYGRNIFSGKVLFNNREAKPTGWAPVLPLFEGSFLNYGGSFERISKNGLCSFEIPFSIGYKNQRSKDLDLNEFVNDPVSFEAQASVQNGEYQIANYQQTGLRFKLFPVGQEQVSYFIGPYVSGSRGEFQKYKLINTQDIFNPIYELESTEYYSLAVGMHNGMSITPGRFVTFNLGAGLGMQLLNTSGKDFQRTPSYYIDIGLGIRL